MQMFLILQLEDTDYMIELENKIQLFSACKKQTSWQGQIQTKSQRVENDILSKWNP
jgi:hypothetical protein